MNYREFIWCAVLLATRVIMESSSKRMKMEPPLPSCSNMAKPLSLEFGLNCSTPAPLRWDKLGRPRGGGIWTTWARLREPKKMVLIHGRDT